MDRVSEPDSEAADVEAALPSSPWRRPLLLVTSLSLLAAGAVLNAERLGLSEPALLPPDDDATPAENRFVAYMNAPDDAPEVEAVETEESTADDEAGGAGQRHAGEEGRMGRPMPDNRSGLYAMGGPRDSIPQMARNFDPEATPRNAGILGQLQQDSGHLVASTWSGERYGATGFNAFVPTKSDAKSTLSIDVDTAAYANTRRFLVRGATLPPPDAVRTEELINYFDYDYAPPVGDVPFSVTTEVGSAPWNAEHRLVHVGLQGKVLGDGEVPPRNLVFLVDVSGSMSAEDKLPLIKHGLGALVEQLGKNDWISIVVYAGAAGAVLRPTRGDRKHAIRTALQRLEAGGGTHGAAGIRLAYQLARRHYIEGGVNRVILASDGDFNVGVSWHEGLVELIEDKRDSGIFLSVLGVGRGNFNDHTMEQLADKGNGNYAYIDGVFEARKVLVEEAGAMLDTIAKDVKIQVEFDPEQVAFHRLVGYENRKLAHEDFDDDREDAGEVGAGHTVTALYEVAPTEAGTGDGLMQLAIRYKDPEGGASRKLTFAVDDVHRSLAEASETFRFSAAVATFAQKLRGSAAETSATYTDVLELAGGAVGEDPHCYRREFLDLVWRAGILAGEPMTDVPANACRPDAPPPELTVTPPAEPDDSTEARRNAPAVTIHAARSDERLAFVLEVLRLLPPLLALPLFILAFRRPRRRST